MGKRMKEVDEGLSDIVRLARAIHRMDSGQHIGYSRTGG